MCLVLGLALLAPSCKKYQDTPGQYDPRLSRPYCNDPTAVNYNFDFPGTADNSVCIYPSDLFVGDYSFEDSVFSDGQFVEAVPLLLRVSAKDQNKFLVTGFCANSGSISFTANRALFAYADTLVGSGQILCRLQDTVSGTITRTLADSVRLHIFLNVVSDTGVTTHQGTAYRQ